MLGAIRRLSYKVTEVSSINVKHISSRSVFMSLRDLPNEGRVLVGLAFAALELVTTGSITE